MYLSRPPFSFIIPPAALQSVAEYQKYSRQRIFVEYVLLAGVNDGESPCLNSALFCCVVTQIEVQQAAHFRGVCDAGRRERW